MKNWRSAWPLDPDVVFCNHGSFGACPTAVLEAQAALRDRMEADPVRFFEEDYERLLDTARAALAAFVGADADGLVFVDNATTGASAFLMSYPLQPGDEVLITNHGYESVVVAVGVAAARAQAEVRAVDLPVPLADADAVVEAIAAGCGSRTRLLVVDHLTSPTALRMPVEAIVTMARERGVDVLVDGAHGPGQVAVDVTGIGAAAYVGNCHKWMCAPKGAGFLWVRPDLRDVIRPPVVAAGERRRRPGRPHLHDRFDWQGTRDPTAKFVVPTAIDVVGAMAGGWDRVRDRNHGLARLARGLFVDAGWEPLGSDDDLGAMVAARPPGSGGGGVDRETARALTARLFREHRVRAPFTWWPGTDRLALRLSAHLHTAEADLARAVTAAADLLRE